MRYRTTRRFDREFARFSTEVQKAFEKQVGFLVTNLRHPSLRAKKYDETIGVWQARATNNVRFYFVIQDDVYLLLDIEKHKD